MADYSTDQILIFNYMLRDYLLDRAKDGVKQHMRLRKPQLDCLNSFQDIYKNLPDSLAETPQKELLRVFQEARPEWHYKPGFPEMTCALATGVGKTRLMGALMAYLFKSGESSNFLILAPRTTIVDKFLRQTQAHHPKYIFVESSFVSQPIVYHSGNFESFDPREREMQAGPTIWVLSPQAISGSTKEESRRFHRPSEYLGQSPFEYMASLDDLVVLFDESHHMGAPDQDGVSAWSRAVREIHPRMVFAMTASPRSSANILDSYLLPECLQDQLYTKGVRVIADQKPDGIDDWDWDKVTLRYALQRLDAKETKLASFQDSRNGTEERIKPVALVCTKDKTHAEDVTRWLEGQLGSEKVLLVHSGLGEKQYLEQLLTVENPGNEVRVIVQVMMLSEGWDVNNVYVIAPLRAMATPEFVLQTMGRGLRLPYGERVGVDEIDTLDVLCFGKPTMNEVVDYVLDEGYGSREDDETYVNVTEREDLDEESETKTYTMEPDREFSKGLPNVDWKRPRVDLSNLKIGGRADSQPLAIDLSDPRTVRRLDGKTGYEWNTFLSMVSAMALRKRKIIGSVTDSQYISSAIEDYLLTNGLNKGDLVQYDPEYVSRLVIKTIDTIVQNTEPEYMLAPGETRIEANVFDIEIPDVYEDEVSCDQTWQDKFRRQPVAGWQRCVYKAVPFDTSTEFHVAKLLDRSDDVEWWLRNLRRIFHLNTPAGVYSPDFLFLLKLGLRNVLLEVKGEHLAAGADAKSVIKAHAAELWCRAMSDLVEEPWEHWFVLNRDAREARDLQDLETIAEDWRLLHLD